VTSDRKLVSEIAARSLPDDVAARWLRLLRPAAALRRAGPGARVAAVLGGEPSLPDWAEWPVWQDHGPLSFIAAIDCAALAEVPLDITLPGAGTLLFFYFDGQYDNCQTTVGFWEPSTLAGTRLLHIGPGEVTSPRGCPAGLERQQGPVRRTQGKSVSDPGSIGQHGPDVLARMVSTMRLRVPLLEIAAMQARCLFTAPERVHRPGPCITQAAHQLRPVTADDWQHRGER